MKLRGQDVVLRGGSIVGVSPPGVSILIVSTAEDFDEILYSLLCRSFAAVWGSGVLPEEDHPCLGTANKQK